MFTFQGSNIYATEKSVVNDASINDAAKRLVEILGRGSLYEGQVKSAIAGIAAHCGSLEAFSKCTGMLERSFEQNKDNVLFASTLLEVLQNGTMQGLFAADANKVLDLFRQKNDAGSVGSLLCLRNGNMAEWYSKDPSAVDFYLVQIASRLDGSSGEAYDFFSTRAGSRMFESDPDRTLELLGEIYRDANAKNLFKAIKNEKIAEVLAEDPERALELLREVIPQEGTYIPSSMFAREFARYFHGKISSLQMGCLQAAYNGNYFGSPLDRLHGEKREEYLNGLEIGQVIGLLASQSSFHTSTDLKLIGRLKEEYFRGGKTLETMFGEFGLDETLQANFIMRMMKRGQSLTGPVFSGADLEMITSVLLRPCAEFRPGAEFDQTYFYMLANALKDLPEGSARQLAAKTLDGVLAGLKTQVDLMGPAKKTAAAIEYLIYKLEGKSPGEISFISLDLMADLARFERYRYSAERGGKYKLCVVEVFDCFEMKDSFEKTLGEFRGRKGFTETVDGAKHVFESDDAYVVLYMGDTQPENAEFLERQLKETPNAIVAYRGHSYYLEDNVRLDSFRGAGNVLFVMGSCGSTTMVSKYMAANPGCFLSIVSNDGIGVGAVNDIIINALMDYQQPPSGKVERLDEILSGKGDEIRKGGSSYNTSLDTINTWSWGESLVRWVLIRTEGAGFAR